MSTETPKIKCVVVGVNKTVLVSYYEKRGEYLTDAIDVFFPSLKKEGFYMQAREQLDKKHKLYVSL